MIGMIELIAIVGGIMTTIAPILQVIKTLRSRDYNGLSYKTYILLLCLASLGIIFGIQYRIFAIIILNCVVFISYIIMLLMLSRMALAAFILALVGAALLSLVIVPWFLPLLFTPRWSEQVGFIFGLISAAAFVPQLLLTYRTRVVSSFSLHALSLLVCGLILNVILAVMLENYSLTFWNFMLFIMVLELLRLKVVGERRNRHAQGEMG
jgi:MtN3 and saliva related transmembrane protein